MSTQRSWVAGALAVVAVGVWIPQLLSMRHADPVPDEEPAELSTQAVPEPRTEPGATSLTALEAQLESLARNDASRDPGELFARLALERAPDSGAEAPAQEPDRDALEAFARENPLTGLILGEDGAAALLGHRIVRPGDALEGGAVEVSSIGDGWIELARAGARLRMELPAFRARGGSTSTGASSASHAEPAPGGNEPASPPSSPEEGAR